MNHSHLPSIATAQLPAKYEAAKFALSECNRIDECKDWADKAQALASYAKQAEDKEMEKTAMRIRSRAVSRCGELLKEIEKASGKRTDLKPSGGAPTRLGAATQAGLSKDQAVQAIRVANVPRDEFESQVESDNPPTVTALANQGKKRGKPEYEKRGMSKEAFQAGLQFRGALSDYVAATKGSSMELIIEGSTLAEKKDIISNISKIDKFNDKLIAKL